MCWRGLGEQSRYEMGRNGCGDVDLRRHLIPLVMRRRSEAAFDSFGYAEEGFQSRETVGWQLY